MQQQYDDTIVRREPLTTANVQAIARALSPIERMVIRLSDVDLSKGAGVLSHNRKCVWTTDGHRITFGMLDGGGLIASIGKDVDSEINGDNGDATLT